MMKEKRVRPVILAGGMGRRLAPLSQPSRPKAFLPLLDGKTLLHATAERLARLSSCAPPFLVCLAEHYGMARAEMDRAGLQPHRWILEPMGRDTALAILLASLVAAREDGERILAVLPSDHDIADTSLFNQALQEAAETARRDYIVALGVEIREARSDYGYIRQGAEIEGRRARARRILHFAEKPSLAKARLYQASGDYLWNCGIFVGRAHIFLRAFQEFAPSIFNIASEALKKGAEKGRALYPAAELIASLPPQSFDRAVMEKIKMGAVVRTSMAWRDLGSWRALQEGRGMEADKSRD